jgi:hypothetical protein
MGDGMRLIWCQGGNRRSAEQAVKAGWWYGFRSDDSHSSTLGPVALLDSHWEAGRVDWPRHLDTAAQVRPWLAIVPDTLTLADLDRTIFQAEQLAPFCASVLVVPKCAGLIERLPHTIGAKLIVLGYSIPTSYGGTPLPLWDFISWPVHLLGGNASRQSELCSYLNVISADGNIAWRLARRGVVITDRGTAGRTLRQLDGARWAGPDAHHEALRRSLANLRLFWSRRRAIEWKEGAV